MLGTVVALGRGVTLGKGVALGRAVGVSLAEMGNTAARAESVALPVSD